MKRLRHFISPILLAILIGATALAQDVDQKLFSVLPEQQRESLIKRLKIYLELDRTRQTDKLEELYDNATLCSLCKGRADVDCEDKAERDGPECVKCQRDFCKDDADCVKNCLPIAVFSLGGNPLRSERLEFKLSSVERIKGNAMRYKIVFDSTTRLTLGGETRVVKEKAVIEATLQKGEWYFSMLELGSRPR